MVKQVTLTAKTREKTGSGAAGRLRRDGWIPAVIYGHDRDSQPLKVDDTEFRQLLMDISVDNTLVDLDVEGDGVQRVLIREVQTHPWRSQVLHVDFFQIREDEEIRVAIPIRYTGEAQGVRESGGILQTNRNELEVECLPEEIPEYFELDVGELEIGDSLHVADLNTGGVRPLEDLDATLCVVVPPTIVEVEEEVAEEEVELEELEPELVGEEEEAEVPEGEEAPAEGEGRHQAPGAAPPSEGDEGEGPAPEDLL